MHLASGEKISLKENAVLVGYTYKEGDDVKCQKQRAKESTFIMLTPNWKQLVDFVSSVYCFEVRDNGNRGKIYFSHSINAISFN